MDSKMTLACFKERRDRGSEKEVYAEGKKERGRPKKK